MRILKNLLTVSWPETINPAMPPAYRVFSLAGYYAGAPGLTNALFEQGLSFRPKGRY
jgi:hypothetical protein